MTTIMSKVTELERYADPLDQASARTVADDQARVERARQALAPQQERRPDGTYEFTECVEPGCGEELPKERLAMGRIRCTTCQDLLEKKAKRFAR